MSLHIERILVSTDFSEAASMALPCAVSLANAYGAELHVVHVLEEHPISAMLSFNGNILDPSTVIESHERDRKHKLQALRKTLAPKVKVFTHLRRGVVATELLAAAAELKPGFFVIATHGHSGFSHLLFGSVAERVVRACPCPTVTVSDQKAEPVPNHAIVHQRTHGS